MAQRSQVGRIEGHTDTVGLGDESQWTVDPFGGVIQEGRLYGRGAMDMKGGLGAAVMAAKASTAHLE